mmetsp:Transcript_39312/g.60057  ORF Transcript_39312/g.60057 Transcript_39312/m.60057 type:complete len:94 (+) Transcript_39312:217-498(+)
MLPYIYINVMLWLASKYSQFWEDYVLFFLVLIGILITNVTGNFNLKSSAKMRLNPVYLDPFVFGIVLYLDYNRILPPMVVLSLYGLISLNRAI